MTGGRWQEGRRRKVSGRRQQKKRVEEGYRDRRQGEEMGRVGAERERQQEGRQGKERA